MLQEAGKRYQAGDHAAAFNLYLAVATAGNTRAMYNVAMLYESGAGVERHPGNAMKWYRKAADAGVTEAMNRMGLLFERGDGTPADIGEALRWYRRAAAGGNKLAAGNIERLRMQE